MKLLMFYAHSWRHRTASRGLPDAPGAEAEGTVENAAVVFFHAEARDEDDPRGVRQKFLKNVKWLAGKFGTRNVVLHPFNHLSSSKSSPEFADSLLADVRDRLVGAGFSVLQTPFGYFNEFEIHVAGDSLAKVFKEF